MTHPLERYPDYGDPHITLVQIDELEKEREERVFMDPYDSLPPEAIIPRYMREHAGLSRQCMQSHMPHHLRCIAGTRNSCTCLCHVENRTVDDTEIQEMLT